MLRRINDYSTCPDVSPRTRETLSNERWYGDGPPQWYEGKAQRPAQTDDEAHAERRKIVKRLCRHAADNPEAQALADRLNSCVAGRRCMSGACPECSRAYTRWFVASSAVLLGDIGIGISALSLVHADHSVPVGKLTPEHLQKAKKKIQAILMKAGITTFVGGIDLSANEAKNHEFDPYYQIQWWLLAPTHEVNSAERQLRRLFPRTETTPRPVKIQVWDGNLAALGYALKSEFDRRVSYHREANESGLKHACRNTRDRALRVDQHIELMIALDHAGLQARLHLGGCRVVGTADGPEIRMIKGKIGGDRS